MASVVSRNAVVCFLLRTLPEEEPALTFPWELLVAGFVWTVGCVLVVETRAPGPCAWGVQTHIFSHLCSCWIGWRRRAEGHTLLLVLSLGNLVEDAAGCPRLAWASTRTLTQSQQFVSYWEGGWDLVVACCWWWSEVSISMTSFMFQERINSGLIFLGENWAQERSRLRDLEWVVTAVCSSSLEVQACKLKWGKCPVFPSRKPHFQCSNLHPGPPLSHSVSAWQ